jgi:hypothetical protein
MLGYFFPGDAEAALALAVDESRVWAGNHYRSDLVAGAEVARAVAGKVIDRVRSDGS